MALALDKKSVSLQTSYPHRSFRQSHSSPPRYFTPSRSTRSTSAQTLAVQGASARVDYVARFSQLALRILLIAVMSIGVVYCASTIVGSSTNLFFKLVGLLAWACGFVPLVYYLWHSKLD